MVSSACSFRIFYTTRRLSEKVFVTLTTGAIIAPPRLSHSILALLRQGSGYSGRATRRTEPPVVQIPQVQHCANPWE